MTFISWESKGWCFATHQAVLTANDLMHKLFENLQSQAISKGDQFGR